MTNGEFRVDRCDHRAPGGLEGRSKAQLGLDIIWDRDHGWHRKERKKRGARQDPVMGSVHHETERQGVRHG